MRALEFNQLRRPSEQPVSTGGGYALAVIALISCSMLIYEILLTRISALRLFFHFGFLIISNCLLGIGASGTMISLCQDTWRRRPRFWIFLFCALYVLSLPLTYAFLRNFPIPYNLSFMRIADLARFSIYNFFTALPFFFAGTVVGLILTFNARRINIVYFADLAGAGMGCLLVPFLLERYGAGGSIAFVSILALLGAMVAYSFRHRKLIIISGACLVAIAFALMPDIDRRFPIPGKDLLDFTDELRLLISESPQYSKWGANCRIDLIDLPEEERFIFGRGRNRSGLPPLPEEKLILQDGSSVTPIINFSDHPEALDVVERSMYTAALQLKERPSVLVIGPGGGVELWGAKLHNARLIKGVELNEPIVDIHRNILPEYSRNLLNDPRVELIHGEGRSDLMRDHNTYDIIMMTFISTYTAMSSGAYVLAESYLYTCEAFENMYNHLENGGVLQIIWGTGTTETLRLLSTMHSILNDQNAQDFPQSVICLRTKYETEILFKKGIFTEDEVRRVSRFARDVGLDVLYLPNRSFGTIIETFVRAKDKTGFINDCSVNISPITDDKPYFFFLSRWPNPLRLKEYKWELYASFLGNPMFLLFQLGISVTLSVGLIMIPLVFFSRKGIRRKGARHFLVYFACLGLGFIAIEIALMQKFTLFLGLPLYSITVTLFSILIFTGLGSLLSAKWFHPHDAKVWVIPFGLTIWIGILTALYPLLMNSCIHYLLPARMAITVGLLAPIGLLLGVPFAYGIRMVDRCNSALVPWAWAVNGCCTVVGAILTVVLSMNFGFNKTLMAALMIYMVGFAALQKAPSTPEDSELPEPALQAVE
jgi:spermidine synthase